MQPKSTSFGEPAGKLFARRDLEEVSEDSEIPQFRIKTIVSSWFGKEKLLFRPGGN
jgi:hypothetical protein